MLKTRCFSLIFLKIWSKIGKNLVFLASFCKGDFQKSQKTSSFYAFFEKMLAQNVQKHACFCNFCRSISEKDAENTMFLAHFDKIVSPKAVQTRWFCMLTWRPKGSKWKEKKTQKARMKGNERWEGKNKGKWKPKRPKWRVRRQK